MEDDAQLPATFSLMVRDCIKELPNDWGIWILGWNHTTQDIPLTKQFRQVLYFTGAHCYILSRAVAKLLVKHIFPIETHIEYYMTNLAFLKKFRIIRNLGFHVGQMDRVLNVSDVRKQGGCSTCSVDDSEEAMKAKVTNMP